MSPDVEALAKEIVEGTTRALARGLTWVEAGGKRAEALCARLYPDTGRAQIVGVTGAPGSGKSTLVRALALVARARGRTVGVVAVDPSSPFSGGNVTPPGTSTVGKSRMPASAIIIAGKPLSHVAMPITPARMGSERTRRRKTMAASLR